MRRSPTASSTTSRGRAPVVYEHPWAYELACSFRDVRAEVDVLRRWAGNNVGGVLELAAGPAEHARDFACRGVPATALDLSPEMCAYARERGSGLPLTVV